MGKLGVSRGGRRLDSWKESSKSIIIRNDTELNTESISYLAPGLQPAAPLTLAVEPEFA